MPKKPDLPPLLLPAPPELPPAVPLTFRIETDFSTAAQARFRNVWRGKVIKTHGGAAQVAGTPDLLGCLAGRMVACELKQPGNRPTGRQMNQLRGWAMAGAVAGWATTLAELDELLAHCWEPAGAWVNPQLGQDAEHMASLPTVGGDPRPFAPR